MPDKMGLIEVDALTEAGNIGAGHAATSLSKLLREHIMNRSTKSVIVSLDEVPDVLGGAERAVAGIYAMIVGEINGGILMIFPEESAKTLTKILDDSELKDYQLTEFQASLLSEVGNICLCWYLSAISKLIDIEMVPSPPMAAYDMIGAVIDLPLIELGKVADIAMVILTDFTGEVNNIEGIFMMLPEPESQKKMAKKLGVE